MQKDKKDIVLLCDVIDNFGDAGFALRLIKRLKNIDKTLHIRLFINNLKTLSLLAPQIQPQKKQQSTSLMQVFDSNDYDLCQKEVQEHFPFLILQCLECLRPQWLEDFLFCATDTHPTCQIINIEYLTAQDYALTFHKLLSLTRSAKVKKVNFMPGFQKGTGGLIIDKSDIYHKKNNNSFFVIFVFLYEFADFKTIIEAINQFAFLSPKKIKVQIAQDSGGKAFLKAAQSTKQQNNFQIETLPFLTQDAWDKKLMQCDFAFVRGEDSLSRVCVWGIPFVWQAYRQQEEAQEQKVAALLKVISPHFAQKDFCYIKQNFLHFNTYPPQDTNTKHTLCNMLSSSTTLEPCFKSFSNQIKQNGDFAQNLLDFIKGYFRKR